jgi:uncharacterized membrane protein
MKTLGNSTNIIQPVSKEVVTDRPGTPVTSVVAVDVIMAAFAPIVTGSTIGCRTCRAAAS